MNSQGKVLKDVEILNEEKADKKIVFEDNKMLKDTILGRLKIR